MGIALPVVLDRFALHRFGGQRPREAQRPLGARQHADFQGAQRPAGVAVAHFGQKIERVVVDRDLLPAQSALARRPAPRAAPCLMSSVDSGSN